MFYATRDWRGEWHVMQRSDQGDWILLTGNSNWVGLAAELFNKKEEEQWIKTDA